MATDGHDGLPDVLGQAAEYLNWLKDEGVTQVEIARPIPAKGGVVMAGGLPARQARGTAPSGSPVRSLDAIADDIGQCTRCALHSTRNRTVPGQGNPRPEILFVGEAPGADEDEQGLAFVGAAGQLLTRMIVAMGLSRENVFIANILKCRPPGNRQPTPIEMDTCIPFLKEQIRSIQPKVIVALGATAVRGLLKVETGITKLRGNWHRFEGIDVMPTFHPAYLLRNPPAKKEAWEDLKAVLKRVGRTPPPTPPVKGG